MTNLSTNIEIEKAQSDLVSPQFNTTNLEDRAQVDLDKFISHLQLSNRAKIKFPYPQLRELGPNFIGATGGSGTRVVARIARKGGLFLGANRNRAEDSIELIGHLSIGTILSHWQKPLPPKLHNRVVQRMEMGLAKYLADLDATHLSQPWGWKMPPSIFILPFLHAQFPQLKCLHLVRDGRDMAYSANQNQLESLGSTLLSMEELSWSQPLQSITLWSRLNLLTAEYGERYLPNQYLRVRFEDLCSQPVSTIERIFDFFGLTGDARQIARAEVSYPISLKGWRSQDSATLEQLNHLGKVALQKFGYLKTKKPNLSQLNLEISRESQNVDLYVQEGHYYFERGETKSALTSYQKAIQIDSRQTVEVYQNLGQACAHQEKLPEAIAAYQKALELQPDNVSIYFLLGKMQAQQGNLTEAVASYKKAIELEPWHSWLYENLGEVLSRLERLEEVIAISTAAIELNLHNPKIYGHLASAQLKSGKILDAIANYREALKFHPENSAIYTQLGNAYSQQEDFQEALSCYQKAIEINPKFMYAYLGMANISNQQGDSEEAIAIFQQAIEIDPELTTTYNLLGNVQIQQEDYEAAIISYTRSLELNSKQFPIHIVLGNTLLQVGKIEKATQVYLEALKLQPQDKTIIRKLKAIKSQLV